MGVNINPLPNFANKKILPAAYDDSLSYYELNAKVLSKTNEVVEQVNANTAIVDGINAEWPGIKSDAQAATESANAAASSANSGASAANAAAANANQAANTYAGTLNELDARVSNIIADGQQTEGNTELIDIRNGFDGINYATAGDSVRAQVGGIDSIIKSAGISVDEELIFALDGISLDGGSIQPNPARLRTKYFISDKSAKILRVDKSLQYNIGTWSDEYITIGSFLGWSGWQDGGTSYKIQSDETMYARLVLRDAASKGTADMTEKLGSMPNLVKLEDAKSPVFETVVDSSGQLRVPLRVLGTVGVDIKFSIADMSLSITIANNAFFLLPVGWIALIDNGGGTKVIDLKSTKATNPAVIVDFESLGFKSVEGYTTNYNITASDFFGAISIVPAENHPASGLKPFLCIVNKNGKSGLYPTAIDGTPDSGTPGVSVLSNKTVAIMGDSISTHGDWGTGTYNNVPEIVIGTEDIGAELSAYATYYDIGTTVGGVTITPEMIGTEVAFTPVPGDEGKIIGKPLTYNSASLDVWWKVAADALGFNPIPVTWSGSSVTSHKSESDILKCSYAWHDSQIRKCGVRTPGSMARTAPDAVIIYRGTNDMSHTPYTLLTDGYFDNVDFSYPSTDKIDGGYGYKEGLVLTISKIRAAYPNTRIFLCTLNVFKRVNYSRFPTNNGLNTLPEYNNAIREVANYMGCGIIEFDKDGITFENCYSQGYITDSAETPTHPNAKGHRVMGLKAILDIKTQWTNMQ